MAHELRRIDELKVQAEETHIQMELERKVNEVGLKIKAQNTHLMLRKVNE